MRLSGRNNRVFAMRPILIFAVAVLVAGAYLARFADKAVVAAPTQAAAVQSPDQPMQSSAGQHRMALSSGRDGHFHVDARVNGRHTDFVVDTGATLVILRETDAAMSGIRPMRSEYTAVVSTANGKINAARAKLERIEIGDISVYDVPTLVLPDEALSQNLLGIAFLSKLRRYEVADGRLLLEQ